MVFQNKTIVFLGSSVTYGDNGWSMCEYIKETKGCNVVKWAVSGTTLADVADNSYVSRLKKQIHDQEYCDCFVCQLSTNDTRDSITLGEISNAQNRNDFDVSTTFGAIEFIISIIREKWQCPIFFYTGTYYEKEKYQKMVDALSKLSYKWNFEIIDLWNDPQMRAIDPEDYKRYMRDPVHPNRLGYTEWWGPKFVEAIGKVL